MSTSREFPRPDDVALAALRYYALFHPRPLTETFCVKSRGGEGLMAVADTGFGHTRLVTLAAPDRRLTGALLHRYLPTGNRYFFLVPASMSGFLEHWLHRIQEGTRQTIATTDRKSFRPAGGPPPQRYEATRAGGLLPYVGYRFVEGGDIVCQAFVLWQSDLFAELGVFTRNDYRGRGLARRAVSAVTAELIDKGLTPLYVYDPANRASQRVSAALGYRPTGKRSFSCYGSIAPLRLSRHAS